MDNKRTLLLIDDDADIIGLLHSVFRERYQLLDAESGKEALEYWQNRPSQAIDLIILDLMLPDIEGEQLIRLFRKDSKIPIIVLTAKGSTATLVEVLDMGADDCIFKPFKSEEIKARVRTQLRRIYEDHKPEGELLRVDDLILDSERHEVRVGERMLHLPLKEFDLLHFLMTEAGRVVTKEELYMEVWGGIYLTDDNTISVHISRLRNKLREFLAEDPIETIWGVGFRFKYKPEIISRDEEG